jgi:RNA polymerase primary sigma factor
VIRQSITRAIADQSRTIRIPVHMVEIMNKVMKTERELSQILGREPSIEEMGEVLDMEAEKVKYAIKIRQDVVSLDAPVGDDDDTVLGEWIADEQSSTPEELAIAEVLRERVAKGIKVLTPREQKIIRMRFGLEDGMPYTLERVGSEFGITRERVRQIESKALGKLAKRKDIQSLKGFLDD